METMSSSNKELLEKYIVLEKIGDEHIHIFERAKFSEQDLCECYDKHHVQIDCTDAGCMSLENYYCTELKAKFLKDLSATGFEVDEDSEASDFLDQEGDLGVFVEKWRKEHENHEKVIAYTLLAGYDTISYILSDELGDFKELNEDKSISILNEYLDADFEEISFDKLEAYTENFVFTKSLYQNNPVEAFVEIK